MKRKSRRQKVHHRLPQTRERGSTLLIVMVLMGMLSLLGVIFYVFAAQERSNAEYYSEASKELEDPGLDADTLFDWALEQIIVGTDARLKNSMLWGSRYSLLSNMVGFSTHRPDPTMQPFNGQGVNVIFDVNTGLLGVDQDRDGTIDPANASLLDFIDSPAAQNLNERQLTNGNYPQPDTGSTYPDINSPFLCYVSKVRDNLGNLHRVVKPSYMVPGVLRPTSTSPTNSIWYNDTTVKARVMRAHPGHLYVPPTQSPASPAPRYIATAGEATSLLGAGGQVFPQSPMASTYDTTGAPGAAGPVTTAGRMGAYSYIDSTGALETVEFDYDNDGDGVNESILIDLDFPPQQDATGKMFVPLFLVTIHDLDALLNMNVHGNLAKVLCGPADSATTQIGGTGWFGTDSADSNFYFISQSNLGIGPAEVNPLWALNRRVGVDDTSAFSFAPHIAAFGNAPTAVTGSNPLGPNQYWGESANMEFFWSKIGRYQTAPSRDLFVGVYGEPGRLYNASSAGGRIDFTPGGNALPRPGLSLADDNQDLGEGQANIPYFQHPLDFTGLGSYMTTTMPPAISFMNSTPGTTPDCIWIKYNKYNNSSPANVKWGQTAGLMTNTVTQGLGDDPYEVAFYATDNRDADSVFTADEMSFLQLNNTEIDRLNVTSRLANLLPFNFDKTKGTQSRAESIRRKFTVQSNDRKSFSLPVSARSTFEYNMDPNTSTMKFPPQFGSISRYATTALAEDPIRPAVRYLLEIEVNGQQNITRPQRKLSLNSLLTGSATTPMSFRPLTAHPDDPGTTTITSQFQVSTSLPAYPPQSTAAQEFWARRDRQQLCRDIYVLLYLLGPGADTIDPTATGAYTPAQCAEMAQFAVNLVDAMDHDSIVTRFEYDTDLSNGWNLDDDPYTSPSVPPSTSELDRGEVFGIERLDLSISEAMTIRTDAIAADHTATPWTDTATHTFGYVELFNHSPFNITFDDKEVWQIVATPEGGSERRLTLKSGAGTLNSQQWFSIGCPDADFGSSSAKSVFWVDLDGMGVMTKGNWIVPYQENPNLGLLDVPTPSAAFRVEDGSANPTDLTSSPTEWMKQVALVAKDKKVTFSLRRRLHQTRSHMPSSQANDNDNPWVTIDQLTTPQFSEFKLTSSSDTVTTIKMQLDLMQGSIERKQPLNANDQQAHPSSTYASGSGQNNTFNLKVGGNGQNKQIENYTVWQPHFDRDFTSIVDLLVLPLFSSDQLTTNLPNIKTAAESQSTPYTASAKFLNPNTTPNPNRWHRLLEFVEVPTRTNRNLGIAPELSIPRVPGRMNLNMLRHPENLAALLDDMRSYKINMTDPAIDPTTVPAGSDDPPYMTDMQGDGRDWWRDFLISRDGLDPFAYSSASLKIPVPGLPGYSQPLTPGSRPFRSLADVSYTALGGTKTASIEDTILRTMPTDSAKTTKRGLVELGQWGAHDTGTLDPTIRNRLLAKMANNSTTRSNNFAIFVSVKYFAAASDPAYGGAIRIGGPLNGKPEPEHRGFFVVDRSKLEQGKYTGSANYDFRAFIDYRKTLQTQ